MISGHLEVPDHTTVSGGTLIHSTIREAGTYTSVVPAMLHAQWRRVMSQLRRIPDLTARVSALERAQVERGDRDRG